MNFGFAAMPSGNLGIAIALVMSGSLVVLGCHQLYLGKHVDRLEAAGKISASVAQRVRAKPMKKIGWSLVLSGVIIFLARMLGP